MESLTLTCRFCGHGNPAGARFCNACAEPLHLAPCAHCEAINNRTASRCHKCGASMGEVAEVFGLSAAETGAPGTTGPIVREPAREANAGNDAVTRTGDARDPPPFAPAAFTDGEREAPAAADVVATNEAGHDATPIARHAVSVPLAFSAVAHTDASSPWRAPPRRRRASLVIVTACIAAFALAFALQHYGFPPLRTSTAVATAPETPSPSGAPSNSSASAAPSTPSAAPSTPTSASIAPTTAAPTEVGAIEAPPTAAAAGADRAAATVSPSVPASTGRADEDAGATGTPPTTATTAPTAEPGNVPATGCAPAVAALGLCDAAPAPQGR